MEISTSFKSSTSMMFSILFAIVLGTSILGNHQGAEARNLAVDCPKSSPTPNLVEMDVEAPNMMIGESPLASPVSSPANNENLVMKANAPSIPAPVNQAYEYGVSAVPGPYQGVPGPYEGVPGPYEGVPGPYQGVPGPNHVVPGPYEGVPGPNYHVVPGPYEGVPGPYTAINGGY